MYTKEDLTTMKVAFCQEMQTDVEQDGYQAKTKTTRRYLIFLFRNF